MARSRSGAKPSRAAPARRRWNWRRVFGGFAEFLRNLALIALSAPFVEPVLTADPVDWRLALTGGVFAFAFMAFAAIFEHERRD